LAFTKPPRHGPLTAQGPDDNIAIYDGNGTLRARDSRFGKFNRGVGLMVTILGVCDTMAAGTPTWLWT